MPKSQAVHRGPSCADLYRFTKRQTRPKLGPRIWLRIFSLRSFVLLQALKSCINGHPFQAIADTMSRLHQLHEAIADATKTLQSLLDLDVQLGEAADAIEKCLRAGNKLLVCGNGGSAADAAHFAIELVVRFAKDRQAYPAICLATDGGLLTAAGNDYGFDEIFARQVAAFGQPGDVLICLTL